MVDEDDIRNEISGRLSGPVLQAGSVYGDVVLSKPSSARWSVDESREILAGQLAAKVRALSAQEEEHRRIHDPRPLSVHWHTADEDLLDHWDNINGSTSETGRPSLTGCFTSIQATYESVPSGRLVILGSAGAGKTVLVHRLIVGLLGDADHRDPVPVLFSLSDWNPTMTGLRDWLIGQIVRDYPFLDNPDRAGVRGADALIENGWILPVLDGFDEIPSAYQREAVSEISRVEGPLVVTSRPEEYARASGEAKAVGRAAAIELNELSIDEAEQYLRASASKAGSPQWDEVFDHLRSAPDGVASRNLRLVLSAPLMVILARTIYNDLPDWSPAELLDPAAFPTREAVEEHLLGASLRTLYDSRRTTGAYRTVSPERARHWLGYLAAHLTKRNTHDLTWWQLPSTLHRHTRVLVTFAVIATVLTLMLGMTLWTLNLIALDLFGINNVAPFMVQLANGCPPTSAVAFTIALIQELAFSRIRTKRGPERLRLRLRQGGRRIAHHIPKSLFKKASWELVTGPAIGLMAGFGLGLSANYGFMTTELKSGLFGGLAIGFANVLVVLLADNHTVQDAINPWHLLATDRRVTLVRAIMTLFACGIMIMLVKSSDVRDVLANALLYGILGAAVRLTLSAWGNWLLFARLWLPLTGRLPWRPKRFLEDAYQRGFCVRPARSISLAMPGPRSPCSPAVHRSHEYPQWSVARSFFLARQLVLSIRARIGGRADREQPTQKTMHPMWTRRHTAQRLRSCSADSEDRWALALDDLAAAL